MSIGSERRLAMEAGRRQVSEAGAIGVDDCDAPMGVIVELECNAATVRRSVGREHRAVHVCELKETGAVGIDRVELRADTGVCGEGYFAVDAGLCGSGQRGEGKND